MLAGWMLGLLIVRAGRAWRIDALIVNCSDKRWGHPYYWREALVKPRPGSTLLPSA